MFILGALLANILVLAISWGLINLLVWLASLCFGFEFTFLIGTGVWLVGLILRWIFSAANNN